MRSRLRAPILSLLVAIGLTFLAPAVGAAFKYLHEGMSAPQIVGEDILTGEKVDLHKTLGDNFVMVVFWATWSERSLEQLADLKEFANQRTSQPFKVIAVNVDGETISLETRERILATVRELELPFPVIIDKALESFYEFGVIAVPSSALLDQTGVLRFGPAGYSLTTRDRIVDSIDVLLGLREATVEETLAVGYIPDMKAARYYRLAQNMLRQGMYERALDHLQRAIENDSGFSAPYSLLGEIDLALELPDSALLAYHRALALDSTSIVALTGLGQALLANGELDSARVTLARAIERDETYTPAILSYSLCLARLNQPADALEHLRQARELNPKDIATLYYLGRVSREAGEVMSALEAFETALKLLYPEH